MKTKIIKRTIGIILIISFIIVPIYFIKDSIISYLIALAITLTIIGFIMLLNWLFD